MKKSIPILTIFLATLLAASVSAMADPLRVVTLKLPPYGYVEKGKPCGLNYELVNEIAWEAGFDPQNRIEPLARGKEDIVQGKADMIIMFPTPEINAAAINLGEILPMETVIFGRAGTVLRSFKDVRGKTVATVRGAKYDDRISKKNGTILYLTDNYEQSLKMLLAGRVDLVIGPKLGLFFTAKKMGVPRQAFCDPLVLSVASGRVFVSRQLPETTVKRLNEALKSIKKSGRVKSLLNKYSL